MVLPGGFGTGNLIIEIIPESSRGTYNKLTGGFTTEEFYTIYFEGDLSAFGLESSVYLPGTSTGKVLLDPQTGGHVFLDWAGTGEPVDLFDPGSPLMEFSYTCTVNAAFAAEPLNLLHLHLIRQVRNLSPPEDMKGDLVDWLSQAASQVENGPAYRATISLRTFIRDVELLSGEVIEASDADSLTSSAEAIIAMLDGYFHRYYFFPGEGKAFRRIIR